MEPGLLDIDELLGPATADTSSDVTQPADSVAVEPAVQRTRGEDFKPAHAAGDLLIDFTSSDSNTQQSSPPADDPFAGLFKEQQYHQELAQQSRAQQQQDDSLQEQQQQASVPAQQPRHAQQDQQQQLVQPCTSFSPSLLPVCERLACLGQMLQQHGAAQGEANASIRLLLATISAKQVKTRQLLAGIAVSQKAAVNLEQQQQQPEEQLQQQVQQLQQHLAGSQLELAVSRSELAAVQAEVSQLRAKEAQQAQLLFLREAELADLREADQSYQAEIASLQEKLLEAQADLSRLSASLPGGRSRRRRDESDTVEGAGAQHLLHDDDDLSRSPYVPIESLGNGSEIAAVADVAAAAAGEAIEVISNGAAAEAGFVTPAKSVKPLSHRSSLMTPDQHNIQQLRKWLDESQAALMKAQEELNDSETLVKQLTHQLEQQHNDQQLDGQQHALPQQLQQQAQLVEDLQVSVAAAEAAAETASKERDAVRRELSELKAELSKLRTQLQEARAARAAAVQQLKASTLAATAGQTQDQELLGSAAAAAAGQQEVNAAAARAAAAEAELSEARAAAAAAAAESAALQQQLKHMQEQQAATAAASKEPVSPVAPDDDSYTGVEEVKGPGTPYQPAAVADQDVQAVVGAGDTAADLSKSSRELHTEKLQQQQHSVGSVEYDLLLAVSEKQALQSELAETQQRLLLLLQLVKKAAAAMGKSVQLPAELACVLEDSNSISAAADAAEDSNKHTQSSSKNSSAAADADEVADLVQLVSGLEQRYCCSQQQQNLLLRSKEMQFLLENALDQLHLIKAAAGTDCRCPSQADYQQLAAAMRGDEAAAAAQQADRPQSGTAAAAQGMAAGAATAEGAVGAVIAAAGISNSRCVEDLLHEVEYTAYHDGLSTAHHNGGSSSSSSYLPAEHSADPYSSQHNQQAQQHVLGTPAVPYHGSSCSSDVLRVGAGSSDVLRVGAGSTGTAAMLTTVDEGLGYDGLEGAWWNKSSIEPVTDLPDFLKPKEV